MNKVFNSIKTKILAIAISTTSIALLIFSSIMFYFIKVNSYNDYIGNSNEILLKIAKLSGIVVIIILSLAIAITNYFTKKLTAPIERSSEYLKVIATGDFTQEMDERDLSRKDELGVITNGINTMKDSLEELVVNIKNETIEIENEVEYVKSNVSLLNNDLQDISATTEEVAASMEETAASSEEMAATSQEIQKAAESIALKSQNGSIAANAINESAEGTKENVNAALEKAFEILKNTKGPLEIAINNQK